jgi:hypothetical protein
MILFYVIYLFISRIRHNIYNNYSIVRLFMSTKNFNSEKTSYNQTGTLFYTKYSDQSNNGFRVRFKSFQPFYILKQG